MRSASTLRILGLVALAALTGVVVGCDSGAGTKMPGSGGTTAGSGGTPGGGSGGTVGSGSGGTIGGSGGVTGSGGSVAGSGGSAVVDASPDGVIMGDVAAEVAGPSYGGIAGIEDFSVVKKSDGCGMAPGQPLNQFFQYKVTIPPPGPGRGTGMRVYYIKLPSNYDNTKPYFVIFTAPGCSGDGSNPPLDYSSAAGTEGVIQIGLMWDSGASPNGMCFDDKRTDSVEYKYFETILENANKKLCYDKHKVFIAGHSSGAWLSNQMGCVYGMKSIRAISPASGGLAVGAGVAPPCTELPTPGIWNHNEDEVVPTGNPITGSITAINRALKTNKCGAGDYNTAPRVAYGTNPVCERFSGCPPEFPIVLCHPKTGGHLGNLDVQPARTWQFFKSLP